MPILTTLVAFGNSPSPSSPEGSLIADAQGDLFGTTALGGAGEEGTVFEVVNTGSPNAPVYDSAPITLVSFGGANEGDNPIGSLIADAQGDLFGTTGAGGTDGGGTVFEIVNTGTPSAPVYASTATTLYSFTGGADGNGPLGSLIADPQGDLFGTTYEGGDIIPDIFDGNGTVFEIANTGTPSAPVYANTSTTLVNFNGTGGDQPDGSQPLGSLIADANGDLFGTTYEGGAHGDGTVFEIANTINGYAGTTLVSFNDTDGLKPEGSLIADANGDLFGTTYGGGAYGAGTVFEIVNTGTPSAPVYASTPITLVSFNGNDGELLSGSLIADANGDLFGTASAGGVTAAGGANDDGTVFEIVNTGTPSAPVYASTPTTLFNFNDTDGSDPVASLIADTQGDLFGTTDTSGTGDGTVFELSTGNAFNVISDNVEVSGDFGDDTISSSGYGNVVYAGSGADSIALLNNSDTVNGSSGPDTVSASGTGDVINEAGGAGSDTVTGTDDTITGGTGPDPINMSGFGDVFNGGSGPDTITASGTGEMINEAGGAGSDTVTGTDDTITGGTGPDPLFLSGLRDVVSGGSGPDAVSASGTDEMINEAGGAGSDTVTGTDDTITGGTGSDTISVSGLGDSVTGGSGLDTITASGTNETIMGGGGADSDTVTGTDDAVFSGSAADTISVSGLGDTVTGGSGSDAITATGTSETIYTGTGLDTINVTGDTDTVEAGTQGFTTAALINLSGSGTTFVDGPNSYSDTVVGFSQSAGDTIHLTGTDTVTAAVNNQQSENGGQDTLITLNDGSTILLKGISQIDSSFFS